MSKAKLCTTMAILFLLVQANLLLAEDTPSDSNKDGIVPLAEGSYTDFVETTYGDSN